MDINYKKFIDAKVLDISRCKIVLDMGGGARFQKWLAPYKELFKDCDYRTMDYDARTGADVVGDIHNIPLADESIDGIICHSVLEHIENPQRAMAEMRRILKPGGKLFVYVPSIYPYHARKNFYPDYWRFFDDTMRFLFKGMSDVEIVKRGGYFSALFFFFPLQHKLRFLIDPIASFLDLIFKTGKRVTTAGYYVYATK
jgi:SAM-dependent methyltransferase